MKKFPPQLFFIIFISLPCFSNEIQQAELIKIDLYQKQSLEKDLPLADHLISKFSNKIYVLGKSYLWVLKLENGTLHKVDYNKRLSRRVKAVRLIEVDTQLFLITTGGILHVDLKRMKQTLFGIPEYPGKTIGISTNGRLISWLHTRGMYLFDTETFKYKSSQKSDQFTDKDIATIDSSGKNIIAIRGNYILNFSLHNLSIAPKTLHRGDRPFLGLQNQGDDIFVFTDSTLLLLNDNNRIGQAVPVDGETKLISMASNRGRHFFLFKNKVLEEYDNISKSVSAYYLDTAILPNSSIQVLGNIALLRTSKSVDAFFLKKVSAR